MKVDIFDSSYGYEKLSLSKFSSFFSSSGMTSKKFFFNPRLEFYCFG